MQFADNQWFETATCCNCGMAFAMTTEFKKRKLKDRDRFYCPAGHAQHYAGETEEQRLKKEVERKTQMLEAAAARASKAEGERQSIAKAHMKMRTRVMNGVCPCCNRTFQNLMQHMRNEHPDFKETRTLNVLRTAFGMNQAAVASEAGVNIAYVSAYEREAYLPQYAKTRLDAWVASHEARQDTPAKDS